MRHGRAFEPEYARTRRDAVERLCAFIAGELDAGRRVLAGFDFPFGYPAGVAERLTGRASAFAVWDWLAERIEDEPDNANNRYEVAQTINGLWKGIGPFWGRPRQWSQFTAIPTTEKERTCRPRERRIADLRAIGAKTVWQLAYSGSVGSQVLVGLPALKRLLGDPRIGGRGAVWPFDTGLRAPDTHKRSGPRGNLSVASQERSRRETLGRGSTRPRPGSRQCSGICATGQTGRACPTVRWRTLSWAE